MPDTDTQPMNAPSSENPEGEKPPVLSALVKGWKRRCPNCGHSHLFTSYLKVAPTCASCDAELGAVRADDFPPYVTMFLVGHIIVPLILAAEQLYQPDIWVHLAIWPVMAIVLTLTLLPRIKGTIVGLMWHLKIRGDEFQ